MIIQDHDMVRISLNVLADIAEEERWEQINDGVSARDLTTSKQRLFGNLKALRKEILTSSVEKNLKQVFLGYLEGVLTWESLVFCEEDIPLVYRQMVVDLASGRHNLQLDLQEKTAIVRPSKRRSQQ